MNHYLWQFGSIVMIVIALVAYNHTQQRHAQIVVPALTGDSVLVRTTRGHVVLIDTGNDAPTLLTFIGTYRRQIHTSPVDTIIITQSGNAWQGGLPALVMRGVHHIIWLPASHTDGAVFCASYTVSCTFAHTTDTWRIDDVTLVVDGRHSLWVVWATGQVLVAHGAPEAVHKPTDYPMTGLIYPWAIEPPLALHHHAQIAFVLYSDGMQPKQRARRSMAQRRVGNERLLHEEIDGDIYISLTNMPTIARIPAP